MRPSPPPARAVALILLRVAMGWSSSRLARAANLAPDTISRYETGKLPLDDERLIFLGGLMGYGRDEVLLEVQWAERRALETVAPRHPLAPGLRDQQELGAQAASIALKFEPLVFDALCCDWTRTRVEADRQRAIALIGALEGLQFEERLRRVEVDPEYRLWTLPSELGERSIRAIGGSVEEAGEWTDLARLAAELVEAPEAWRPRLRAVALFFSANVERVGNDLGAAEATFGRAWAAWREKEPEGLPLGEWRYLDLEASLRCDQQRWEDAMTLLRRAIAVAPKDEVSRLQVGLAVRFNEMGRPAEALELLRSARSAVETQGDLRLCCTLNFNFGVSLLRLGRALEAAFFVAEGQRLARLGGGVLDILRNDWLAGHVARDLGHSGAARLVFAEVRQGFTELRMPLDAALAALDEAELLLEEGAHEEVRELAVEIFGICRWGKLHGEVLASLKLFYTAAKRQHATAELARQTARTLQIALSPVPSHGAD